MDPAAVVVPLMLQIFNKFTEIVSPQRSGFFVTLKTDLLHIEVASRTTLSFFLSPSFHLWIVDIFFPYMKLDPKDEFLRN